MIKGCSAGQFDGGIPFERFDCANRDVCFRIDRLVTDGYLHRCDEHPQMILYQPSSMELSSNCQSVSHMILALSKMTSRNNSSKETLVLKPMRVNFVCI